MNTIIVQNRGRIDYRECLQAMQVFTDARDADTDDEIWCAEHEPVYTLGRRSRDYAPPAANTIPVVQTDRGGLVTYHGPGQLMVYLLIDLRRRKLGVRDLVNAMEQSIIALLADHRIDACARADAPGVYVADHKIASLGLRVRNGCSYHGLALNIDMNLSPFADINPCGLTGIRMTQTSELTSSLNMDTAASELVQRLCDQLGYSKTPGATKQSAASVAVVQNYG